MKEIEKKPIRILHIVGGMDTGGVETWLMHVLRRIDRDRFRFDFLTHTAKPCFYDEEIRSLRSKIIPCPHSSHLWRYARNFQRILKENGPYDVVHSHVHHFSGFPLMLAHRAGVSKRIAHSHNDMSLNDRRAGFWRKFYLRTTEWLIRRHATTGLACNGLAAANLFGKDWQRDSRWRVLYCGIDLEFFTHSVNRDEVRCELGIPPNAFVLGHVGRFTEQKNHGFLIDIFAEVVRREPNARLLLVGEGPLRRVIEQKTQRLGLEGKVIFAGVRSDVSRLMLGAMNVFVFPSRHEGLPLTLVEAQASKLFCVFSDAITKESDIVPSLINRLSLERSASAWADVALAGRVESSLSQEQISEVMGRSPFNIKSCLDQLKRTYEI